MTTSICRQTVASWVIAAPIACLFSSLQLPTLLFLVRRAHIHPRTQSPWSVAHQYAPLAYVRLTQ